MLPLIVGMRLPAISSNELDEPTFNQISAKTSLPRHSRESSHLPGMNDGSIGNQQLGIDILDALWIV